MSSHHVVVEVLVGGTCAEFAVLKTLHQFVSVLNHWARAGFLQFERCACPRQVVGFTVDFFVASLNTLRILVPDHFVLGRDALSTVNALVMLQATSQIVLYVRVQILLL